MIPAPEHPDARAWRAAVRLSFELERIGALAPAPGLRQQLLASTSHWAVILASEQRGR